MCLVCCAWELLKLVSWCVCPLEFWWLACKSTTLRLGVERRRRLCAGDVETPTHACLHHSCMICFFVDSLFEFTTYGMQVCLVLLSYLELHKIPSVGKEKGRDIALVREYTHWVIRENHSRNKPCFFKTFLRKTSISIADLGISECSSMHYSDSQQLKTRRRLKAPWVSME